MESVGVLGECSLRREGFVFLSDAAFVLTHVCSHAQDRSISETTGFVPELKLMCLYVLRVSLWFFAICCSDEAFIINGIYLCWWRYVLQERIAVKEQVISTIMLVDRSNNIQTISVLFCVDLEEMVCRILLCPHLCVFI